MRLIFLRHGKDDENYRGGWSELGLLPEGEDQARKVAAYFQETACYDIRCILSSDLPRAVQTAVYTAQALGLPVQPDRQLREIDNGDLAGMENAQALRKYPGLYFNTLAMEEAYPNGESPAAFYGRIKMWFESIMKHPPVPAGDILIVTHGGVINILYHLAANIPWTNRAPAFPADKCSIHILDMGTRAFALQNQVVWRGTMDFQIRRAMQGDGPALAHIQNTSWRAAFRDILSPEDLTRCTDPGRTVSMYTRLLEENKGNGYIGFLDGKPHCIAWWDRAREEAFADYAELICIHSLPDHWRRGCGSRMMDRVLKDMAAAGCQRVMLWVFAENHRARAFYEAKGFVPADWTKFAMGTTEMCYTRQL